MSNHFKRITALFLGVKLLQYLLVYLTPTQFDTSTALFVSKYQSKYSYKWYHKLLSWDSVFYVKSAFQSRDTTKPFCLAVPQYEHEWAFSPFVWTTTLRHFVLSSHQKLDGVVWKGSLLNVLLHYLSIWLLYFLTLKTFPKNHSLAYKTAVLFTVNSAAGFLIAPYSEPLSFALSFIGMYSRECSLNLTVYGTIVLKWYSWAPYMLSSVFFTVASSNRSNCILLGIYYLYDLYKFAKQRDYWHAVLFPSVAGFFMFVGFILNHYYLPYREFCEGENEWCALKFGGFPIPTQSFYSYLQSKYWNVGFLRYWSVNNIPNFLIALPNIILIWYSTVYFSYQYPLESLKPLIYITRSFLIVLVLFFHVQTINRVCSFIPLPLWYISDRLLKTTGYAKGDDKLVYYYIHWLFYWIPLQTILFAAFLPPA